MKKYYTNDGKVPLGPFSLEELKEMHLSATSPIWTEGMAAWTVVARVPELQVLLAPTPPPISTATPPEEETFEIEPRLAPKSAPSDKEVTAHNRYTSGPFSQGSDKASATGEQQEAAPPKKGMSAGKFYTILVIFLIGACILLYILSKVIYGNRAANDPQSTTVDSIAVAKAQLDQQQHQLDSTRNAAAIAQSQHDDSVRQAQQAQKNIDDSYRQNWRRYVSISKNFSSDNLLGGISDISITVVNGLPYTIDMMEIKVKYIKKSGEVYDERTLTTGRILPNAQINITAPDSDRGTDLKVQITRVISSDLGLNYAA